MTYLKMTVLTAAIALCSVSTQALEVTSHNDVKNLNGGLEQRLEASTAAVTAVVNDMNARVTAAEADITAIKGNGSEDEVQRWNTKLEARLDVIETDVDATEADLTTIKNNGANNEVQRWNPKLETRLDTIEAHINNLLTRVTAIEAAPAGALKYAASYSLGNGKGSANTAVFKHDLCVMTTVTFSTTEDNHGHTCSITRSADGYQLRKSGTAGSQGCAMQCYDY